MTDRVGRRLLCCSKALFALWFKRLLKPKTTGSAFSKNRWVMFNTCCAVRFDVRLLHPSERGCDGAGEPLTHACMLVSFVTGLYCLGFNGRGQAGAGVLRVGALHQYRHCVAVYIFHTTGHVSLTRPD